MRWRTLLLILGFAFGLLLNSGCKPKRIVLDPTFDPKRFEAVHRSTYSFQRFNDGQVAVIAKSPKDLDLALDEIGCGKEFICMIQPVGDYFEVTQRKSQ